VLRKAEKPYGSFMKTMGSLSLGFKRCYKRRRISQTNYMYFWFGGADDYVINTQMMVVFFIGKLGEGRGGEGRRSSCMHE
jgi:hypothetical protein